MPGDLTTIVGPMGSGKTLWLVKLLSQYGKAGYEPHLFKHRVDTRDTEDTCRSRAGYELPAKAIEDPEEISPTLFDNERLRIIAFEEGQFFEPILVDFIRAVVYNTDYKVMVTGLNLNFRGEPFGIMPQLMAMSDEIVHLTGVCDVCHGPATKTQRLIGGKPATKDSPTILIGGDESYACRCPQCFVPPV